MRAGLAIVVYLASVAVPLLRPADGVGLYILLAAIRPQNITYGFEVWQARYSIVALVAIVVGWMARLPGRTDWVNAGRDRRRS